MAAVIVLLIVAFCVVLALRVFLHHHVTMDEEGRVTHPPEFLSRRH